MVPCSISATRVSCPEALITKMFDIEGSLCGARGRTCAIRERMRQSEAALGRQNGLRSVDGHQFLPPSALHGRAPGARPPQGAGVLPDPTPPAVSRAREGSEGTVPSGIHPSKPIVQM